MKKTYESWDAHLIDCQLKGNVDWAKVSPETLKEELNKAGYKKAKELYYANPDFIYREIAGENILVPTGKAAEELYGIVSLNTTGKLLWDALQEKCTLLDLSYVLMKAYDLEQDQSIQDVKDFIKIALSRNIVLRTPNA